MRLGILASVVIAVVVACGSSVETEQHAAAGVGGSTAATGSTSNGTSSTGSGCTGSSFPCAAGCGSDYFPENSECVGGAWKCPEGTIDPNDCPPGTCWGLPLPCEQCGPTGWECKLDETCLTSCDAL